MREAGQKFSNGLKQPMMIIVMMMIRQIQLSVCNYIYFYDVFAFKLQMRIKKNKQYQTAIILATFLYL